MNNSLIGTKQTSNKLVIGVNDLATVNPKLASQWDHEKNEKGPSEYTSHSNFKVNWLCNTCGMSYVASINKRSYGRGCPYCARKLPIVGKTDFASCKRELLDQWDYEKNEKIGRPEEFTVYSHKKINWKCTDCGMTWEASISARSRGEGCPYCAGKLPIPGKTDLTTVNPDLAAQWDFERNEKRPEDYTANSGEKVWWKSITGCSWQARITDRNNGNGDPYLSRRLPIPGKTDLATVMPDLAAQWDYERNEKRPEDYTVYSRKKVWWRSVTGASWQASISSRSYGKGDPYLSRRLPIPGKTDLATKHPELAEEWDWANNPKGPQHYTCFSNVRVSWICRSCGNTWKATISDRSNGKGCPYCSGLRSIPGKTDLATVNPKLAAEWDNELNAKGPENYKPNSTKMVWWICSDCGTKWLASIVSRNRKGKCPNYQCHDLIGF